MDIKTAKRIHFSGIKGVGMTALALYAQDRGIRISGSDVADQFVTEKILTKRRIEVAEGFAAENLNKDVDLLVYSGARPQNPEVKAAQRLGIRTLNYAQALAQMVSDKAVIATCGVGGKSTTAAMLATILSRTGRKPSFVVGVGNILGLGVPGRYQPGKLAVVEADDYVAVSGIDNSPKFLYLNPMITIVTNIEFDHPDVYRNLEETKRAFQAFFLRLPKGGVLIGNIDSPAVQSLFQSFPKQGKNVEVIPYGFSPQASWRIQKVVMEGGRTEVRLTVAGIRLKLALRVPGKFNAANATAALIAATQLGVAQTESIKALEEYQGTMRRFQPVGIIRGIEVWDDYAHHPKEITATLSAARKWFPNRRIVAVFQPHTYSRTKALLPEFAKALSLADEAIVTDIYGSAREAKDPTISGRDVARIAAQVNPRVRYCKKDHVLEYLKQKTGQGDVVLTLGAGDIYRVGWDFVRK
ncbi:MAG: UDP-N-acetylmuramate--L-alanine ligase [Candidatus Chisholmbacteria bacterium RIFCSPLOWO2_01_FULL_50_28]|uniref:UDP-N-acetylmuramate--L-alanine ligase n=1 Tax=Candidatus Chisholmbacteria bacterium RIFCSPHIGHO2_01_FULL_52_32 TaxID=1797591 RepID=A0A1G1VSR6_9BACT|nr:MAG: UDP-N-acetylmuramate--L-alanine ligase [Candidatus Chisholmbacteria bacterium RIFCSPHIGHO2_01_FULL_52_32]OGY20180.1 MAG: UDP-N-acetylmuramate--L-alanine ligase [Candidatus Chisholmbacteria bacterium RIFCSPLOWO2_01_FULL_50_28]